MVSRVPNTLSTLALASLRYVKAFFAPLFYQDFFLTIEIQVKG